ncbi:MAG: cell division protein FtsB [Pseudomonadota bacterium]
MRLINLLFVLLAALLQYQLWFGQGGLRDSWRLERDLDRQQTQNESLLSRNRELRAQVLDLKTGTEAVEELARSELGLMAPGEVFYQIVDPD